VISELEELVSISRREQVEQLAVSSLLISMDLQVRLEQLRLQKQARR
jgi:hypothetical protein